MSDQANSDAISEFRRTDIAHGWRLVLWALGIVGALCAPLLFVDGPITGASLRLRVFLPGDVQLTLRTLQQFGDVGTMAIAILLILFLDRDRVRRTLDWVCAAGVGLLIFNGIKVATGRLRPIGEVLEVMDGADFMNAALHFFAWDSAQASFDSRGFAFPSTHTTHAFIAAVFLTAMYPKLRPLVFGWAGLVGVCRVLFGAHWPSDVVAGAVLGYVWARLVVDGYWGVRLVDWVWRAVVDRRATPALPGVLERERAHRARHTDQAA
ncbi:MAG: phosphatase PAP2 family protein [Planctomycetota bacterium]